MRFDAWNACFMIGEVHTRPAIEPLLSIRNLSLSYRKRALADALDAETAALHDVSLDVFPGKTLALAGPSGSGKSSLARCILAVEKPQSGRILYRGNDLLAAPKTALKAARREIHLILQDSTSALNPGLTVEQLVAEPLRIHCSDETREKWRIRIREALDRVELPEQFLDRMPLELSGGQRQRVAIARALVVQPSLLILDEALSSLDLSAQGQIANLLLQLQEQVGLAYLFITHDTSLAVSLAHQLAVMNEGRITQQGTPSAVLTANLHSNARTLATASASGETVMEPSFPKDK